MRNYPPFPSFLLTLAIAIVYASPAAAAETSMRQDMTAVISLLGLPCGEVVNATLESDKSRMASCKDGNRYRVFIDAAGRVVAQKS